MEESAQSGGDRQHEYRGRGAGNQHQVHSVAGKYNKTQKTVLSNRIMVIKRGASPVALKPRADVTKIPKRVSVAPQNRADILQKCHYMTLTGGGP